MQIDRNLSGLGCFSLVVLSGIRFQQGIGQTQEMLDENNSSHRESWILDDRT
jgi:hypothetical protein